MSKPHALLRLFRLLHLYIGVFVSPALIFFAFTGALQTFSLHETTPGSTYQPPRWAMTLAQIHKKQTPIVPDKKKAPPAAVDHHHARTSTPVLPEAHGPSGLGEHGSDPAGHDAGAAAALARTHHPLPLKVFFLLVSIGLFTLTLTGLYMSWKFTHRRRGLFLATLIAGIILPVALVFV